MANHPRTIHVASAASPRVVHGSSARAEVLPDDEHERLCRELRARRPHAVELLEADVALDRAQRLVEAQEALGGLGGEGLNDPTPLERSFGQRPARHRSSARRSTEARRRCARALSLLSTADLWPRPASPSTGDGRRDRSPATHQRQTVSAAVGAAATSPRPPRVRRRCAQMRLLAAAPFLGSVIRGPLGWLGPLRALLASFSAVVVWAPDAVRSSGRRAPTAAGRTDRVPTRADTSTNQLTTNTRRRKVQEK